MSIERLSAADETLSPVDLPDDPEDDGSGLLWSTSIITIAALLLLFTNASAISAWADGLEPGPTQERIAEAAGTWQEVIDRLGLSTPVARAHAMWKDAQAARFGSERPQP